MRTSYTPPIFVLTSVLLLLAGCSKEKLTPNCDGSTPVYNSEIEPIISANCTNSTSCHGSGAAKIRGELHTYALLKAQLDNGTFLKRVLEKQNMPKGKVLTQDEINLIQCWVNNDYPEN